jgi:hypothetical protein
VVQLEGTAASCARLARCCACNLNAFVPAQQMMNALAVCVATGSYDFNVTCYMLELYNDQLIDLLIDKKKGETPPALSIKLVLVLC